MCRENLEDAIEKLQSFIDAAALAVQPIEEDPLKKKKLDKQCASFIATIHFHISVYLTGSILRYRICCSVPSMICSEVPCFAYCSF